MLPRLLSGLPVNPRAWSCTSSEKPVVVMYPKDMGKVGETTLLDQKTGTVDVRQLLKLKLYGIDALLQFEGDRALKERKYGSFNRTHLAASKCTSLLVYVYYLRIPI